MAALRSVRRWLPMPKRDRRDVCLDLDAELELGKLVVRHRRLSMGDS
jgi:hypothetical protein